jgi:predicted RNA binding protein YcfA (HicA-like mRNA interferase family)
MGSRIPSLSATDVVRTLGKTGFVFSSQRGSHVKLVKGERKVIVPLHPVIARGTLSSILRQAGLTGEQFLKLLTD